MNNVILTPIKLNELESLIQHSVERALKANQSQKAESPKPADQLLTIQQAAEFLNLSKPTLYSKVSRREIPYMKRSKRLYFSRTELMDYLKEGRRKSEAEIQAEAEKYLKNGRA